jgi:pantoate--beta-alanine ligase
MFIFKTAVQLSAYLRSQEGSGKKIGFVPTMGALHQGHLSLVHNSRKENDLTVCSIFINPTQFNNAEDLKHYPVTLEKDMELLLKAGCNVVFLPGVQEIYPPGFQKKHYDLGKLELVFEGRFRPGHFQGVCQVVDRLLEIVDPGKVYLGQKDFQQCLVLKKLVRLNGMQDKVQVRIIPTVREADGLAMSSRNLRLTDEQRKKAPAIFEVLHHIRQNHGKTETAILEKEAISKLTASGFEVDYVGIVDGETLEPASNGKPGQVVLVAAALPPIRLIDNMALN